MTVGPIPDKKTIGRVYDTAFRFPVKAASSREKKMIKMISCRECNGKMSLPQMGFHGVACKFRKRANPGKRQIK